MKPTKQNLKVSCVYIREYLDSNARIKLCFGLFMSHALYTKLSSDFFAILGPCVIESLDHTLFMAENIQKICDKLQVPFVFKASFDKANRTSIHSFRGPGLEKGLQILDKVKQTLGVAITTDFHEPQQAMFVAQVADILQIPAFLCRQTDLILSAAETKKIVSIKKGQFVAPYDMQQVVEKCKSVDNPYVFLIERGTTFGYNNLVVDMRSFKIMNDFAPTIFDATHSLQLPGKGGTYTEGQREFLPNLSAAAIAAGAKALFMEVHNQPNLAKSDASTVYPLEKLEKILQHSVHLYRLSQEFLNSKL
jgi:2-dehydro-3-deoxyphosphooctonate aldolase (KDO 8-P synthase)